MLSNRFKRLTLATIPTVFILSSCGVDGLSSGTDLSSKTPDIEVSCSTMLSEIDANEARAVKKYDNKVIQISGRVSSIDEDMFGETVVNLSSGQEYSFTNCGLNDVDEETAISLDKGTIVSFKCKGFTEVIGSAMLDNCSLL